MRRFRPAELPAILSFLRQHAPVAMFPLSNVEQHGIAGGHPRAMTFWLAGAADAISDVVGVSDEGMVFPVIPMAHPDTVVPILRETGIRGLIGRADWVLALQERAGLPSSPGLDMVEPHYQLNLEELTMPETADCTLIPLADAPRRLVRDWRRAFCEEALAFPPDESRAKADADISAYLDADTHRVLLRDGRPVAMTGFNATLPEIVQVGGVYTPPTDRARGHARRAVALHLREAHDNGARQAVLSAATDAAARAYEAIGFGKIGRFAIIAWSERQVVNG